MGYFVIKFCIYESVVLVLIVFILFCLDFFMNCIQLLFEMIEFVNLVQVVGNVVLGSKIWVMLNGFDFDIGLLVCMNIIVILGFEDGGEVCLFVFGLMVFDEDGVFKFDELFLGMFYFESFGKFDFYGDELVVVLLVQIMIVQVFKELIYILGFLLLGLVYML